jgi:hypothetical protein
MGIFSKKKSVVAEEQVEDKVEDTVDEYFANPPKMVRMEKPNKMVRSGSSRIQAFRRTSFMRKSSRDLIGGGDLPAHNGDPLVELQAALDERWVTRAAFFKEAFGVEKSCTVGGLASAAVEFKLARGASLAGELVQAHGASGVLDRAIFETKLDNASRKFEGQRAGAVKRASTAHMSHALAEFSTMSRTGTGVPGLGRGFSAMTQGLGGDGRALSAQRTPGAPVKVQPHDYNGYLAIVGRGAAIRARSSERASSAPSARDERARAPRDDLRERSTGTPIATDACRRSPTTTRSRR